ncbi:MAG: S8 family peptidase [Anaplasmataceae bacterium]|nr:S8 family peptidase [Anaplasmataceae bacterium]
MIKNLFKATLLIVLISPLVVSALETPSRPDFPRFDKEARRILVTYKTNDLSLSSQSILSSIKERKIKDLRGSTKAEVFSGISFSEEQLIRSLPEVERVEEDVIFHTLFNLNLTIPSLLRTPSAQTTPWGITKVGAPSVWANYQGDPIKVAVIDTGIDLDHPDLQANIKKQYNAIYSWRNADDDNGHGSHVAGIIAALNNNQGVVGVAPRVDLFAVKVLNSRGSGYLSDIVEGIDWAIQNQAQVINLSLGSSSDSPSLRDAVVRAYNAGVVVIAAAGNNGGAVLYPAAYPQVIAVSATDSNNQLASWSNRGSEVDLAAPGVSIYSTYSRGAYKTLNGTSMASPHVAGVAALILDSPVGTNDQNGNGRWDPSEVLNRMTNTAVDLGATGFDTLFGFGLVQVHATL